MSDKLSRARLEEILQACRRLRIGVVGDFALDGYWYADMTRSQISREAPLFNRPVQRETYTPGGAANVAANLAALQPWETWAFTVLGDDWRGHLLKGLLDKAGIRLEGIKTQSDWSSPFFGKVVLLGWDNQQEDSRLDFVNTHPLPEEAAGFLLEQIESRIDRLDGLIVADYLGFGVVTPHMVDGLNRLAKGHPRTVFSADSRDDIARFQHMVIKPNEVEAAHLFFPDRQPESISPDEFSRAGMQAQAQTGRPLYITRGDKGALLCFPPHSTLIEATRVSPPLDTVGAGDTFIAAVTAALAAGCTPWEAGVFASLASGVTIQKLGETGVAYPEEILELYDTSQTK